MIDIEYEMKQSEITGQYRIILDKLLRKRDLETVFFLRILMETGLRSREVYSLRPEDIVHRKVYLPMKYWKFYKEAEKSMGAFRISRRTEQIARAVEGGRKRYFTRSHSYYLAKIKRYRTDKRFNLHIMRNLRKKIDWWNAMGKMNRKAVRD